MKAMVLRSPIGPDRLALEDRPDPGAPGVGEIRVALHGSSLNFHDLGIATGRMPTAALMARQARLQGLIVGSRREQQDFVRALDSSAIRPVIDRRFPLEQLAEAFRFEMVGGHFGKIRVQW